MLILTFECLQEHKKHTRENHLKYGILLVQQIEKETIENAKQTI